MSQSDEQKMCAPIFSGGVAWTDLHLSRVFSGLGFRNEIVCVKIVNKTDYTLYLKHHEISAGVIRTQIIPQLGDGNAMFLAEDKDHRVPYIPPGYAGGLIVEATSAKNQGAFWSSLLVGIGQAFTWNSGAGYISVLVPSEKGNDVVALGFAGGLGGTTTNNSCGLAIRLQHGSQENQTVSASGKVENIDTFVSMKKFTGNSKTNWDLMFETCGTFSVSCKFNNDANADFIFTFEPNT